MKRYPILEIFLQPFIIFLVSTIIIKDHMNCFVIREFTDNAPQKGLEIFPFLLCGRLGMNVACCNLEGRKQIQCTVPLIRALVSLVNFLVSCFYQTPFPFNGLNTRFLVNTQHQSIYWRIKIEPYYVGSLAGKLRVCTNTP